MIDELPQIQPGQAAALATAVCWTVTALCFEYSSKRIGSLSVNLIKMSLAFALFAVFSLPLRHRPFPTDATAQAWAWLGLSGLIGFVLGDLFLFKALAIIGARTSMLVMALTPLVTALFGFFLLDERLVLIHGVGMTLTLGGVATVILTREGDGKQLKHPVKGIVFAAIGMIGQAVGLVLSKHGMSEYGMGEHIAFASTHIRIIAGLAGFGLFLLSLQGRREFLSAFKHGTAVGVTTVGTVFGPFIGVYLSLVAIQNTQTGVASTIMSIIPVLIIPFSIVLFKERINVREVLGAVVAVAGTAIMFS